jgi:hypothetical protein
VLKVKPAAAHDAWRPTLAFFFALSVSSVGARHAVPERATATKTPAPSNAQRRYTMLLRISHRDELHDRPKVVRKARHAVPLLKIVY